jgi:hypothetical protein
MRLIFDGVLKGKFEIVFVRELLNNWLGRFLLESIGLRNFREDCNLVDKFYYSAIISFVDKVRVVWKYY